MRCHILGAGPTAAQYKPDGEYSIGVNDCGKFGITPDELLFLNRPRHFNEGHRIEVIRNTNVHKVVTIAHLVDEWRTVFTESNIKSLPPLTRWRSGERFRMDQTYHTNNSPFTAMSYAVQNGFREIILWGVDFIDHKWLTALDCAPAFSQFATASGQPAKIYKGSVKSNLVLPVWSSPQ